MKDKNTGAPINQEEISHYLKDIRKIMVMTAERERELAKKMKSEDTPMSERRRIEQELIEGNLRFVITVAKQYQNQGLDLSDLIAEGNLGLMKAIKNFDWNKDLRFISYGVWWIKQSIIQSLNDNSRTIRLPVNVVQDLQRAKKEVEQSGKKLEDKFASLPSMIDLDMNINEDGDTLLDMISNKDAEFVPPLTSPCLISKKCILELLQEDAFSGAVRSGPIHFLNKLLKILIRDLL
jgi:RNA polymerase primary sigma factor